MDLGYGNKRGFVSVSGNLFGYDALHAGLLQ